MKRGWAALLFPGRVQTISGRRPIGVTLHVRGFDTAARALGAGSLIHARRIG